MPIEICEFRNINDKVPVPRIFPDWEALCNYLSVFEVTPTRAEKLARSLWSPVTYPPGKTRSNKNAESVNVAVFDIDHATEEELQELLTELSFTRFFMHSTASDTPDNRSFRLLLPLDAPVKPLQYRYKTGIQLEKLYGIKRDSQTVDPARIYFLPSERAKGAGIIFRGEESVPTDVQNRLFSVKTNNRALAHRIAIGRALSTPGRRNGDILTSAWLLNALFPQHTEQEIIDIITPSLQKMPSDRPFEEELALFKKKLEEARIKKPALDLEEQAANSELEGVFTPTPSDPNSILQTPKYTKEEIAAFDKHHWIIQKEDTFYFRVGKGYTGPFGSGCSETAMRQELAGAPLIFSSVNAKTGARKLLSIREMMASYGVVAHTINGSMTAQHSYYDAPSKTFVEAVAPLRITTPVEHPDVNDWLVMLGGLKSEKLLDWVASVTKLDHQCAALLLEGEASSGKTFLANGLAVLWTKGGPSPFDVLTGNFNSQLVNCPLVFADEGLSGSHNGSVNDILRRAIGQSGFPLRRKFVSDANVIGALRIMMATNNSDILKDFEDLSPEDRNAIAQRILLIGIHDGKAKALLDSLPHSTKAEWANYKIAEHALWLRDNRPVKPGKRFIVEGEGTEIVDRLSVSAGAASDMLEFIFTAAKAGPNVDILLGSGKLLVSANLFKGKNSMKWQDATGNSRLPAAKTVNKTLSILSNANVEQRNGRNYYSIRLELLAAWNKNARNDNYADVMAEVTK